ncbi:MAG: hypothetical protein R3F34_00765 [Planctomycetota bacterium]
MNAISSPPIQAALRDTQRSRIRNTHAVASSAIGTVDSRSAKTFGPNARKAGTARTLSTSEPPQKSLPW